ncbi:MAG: FtsX-like permease family protein [Gemmatimonas sp.]|nr:FtsX-like permease family protein [Gemmatimonas sp.]
MKQGKEGNDGRESRLLRALVRLFPRAFRERFGDDVLRTLSAAHLAASASGARGRVAFWLRNIPDLLVGAVRERIGGSGGRQEKEAGMRPSKTGVVSWLDFKLGFRMLVKYPGLTVVGGLAMAFAIAVGALGFEAIITLMRPSLPFEGGDRVVSVRNWNAAESEEAVRAAHDFVDWRAQLRTVEELGAYRTVERNLIAAAGPSGPVAVAEISASAFRLTGVRPVLGRTLSEADERPGAPRVLVIGEAEWRTRFRGDPLVLGREVRVGADVHTIVGVLPEAYGFPIAHRYWVPLRLNVLDYPRGDGPAIAVFGRLAPGATLEEAQAELTAWGDRMAAAYPETHEHLRPQMLPYTESLFPFRPGNLLRAGLYSTNLLFILFVGVICANVAALVYARTATRESELVVRSALGASRHRIIMQLVGEMLVLGAFAAVVGLLVARFVADWILAVVDSEFLDAIPYWVDPGLSPSTVLYAALLTAFASFVAGALPGFKVTRASGARLREVSAGGGGLRFGPLWTAAIVGQMALSIVLVFFTVYTIQLTLRMRTADMGFAAHQYLTARIAMDRPEASQIAADSAEAAFLARGRDRYAELERRLAAEPGAAGVTFASVLPGVYRDRTRIEVDGIELEHRVQPATVGVNFFETLDVPMLAGRGFESGDLAADRHVAIVNPSFVRLVMGGRNPIGRRVRLGVSENASDPWGRWHEIVGVTSELLMTNDPELRAGGIYLPAAPSPAAPNAIVHVRGEPAAFAPRLREIATAVDPALRVYGMLAADDVPHVEMPFYMFWIHVLVIGTSMALGLSLAGIYSVMAFAVARRTREIGIRLALGADRRRLVTSILTRPFAQAALGVVIGVCPLLVAGGVASLEAAAYVLGFTTLMLAVCLLACVVPIRRALRVEPTEALQGE